MIDCIDIIQTQIWVRPTDAGDYLAVSCFLFIILPHKITYLTKFLIFFGEILLCKSKQSESYKKHETTEASTVAGSSKIKVQIMSILATTYNSKTIPVILINVACNEQRILTQLETILSFLSFSLLNSFNLIRLPGRNLSKTQND